MSRFLFFLPFVLMVVLSGCSGGGLDVETSGGSVTGKVFSSDSIPVAEVKVMLIPDHYDPVNPKDTIRSVVSDAEGKFVFDGIDSGKYNIEGLSSDGANRFFVSDIDAIEKNSVKCILALPGQVLVRKEGVFDDGFFFISGTTHFREISASDTVAILDSVPAGMLPAVYYTKQDGSERTLVSDSLLVTSGNSNVVTASSKWKYSAVFSAADLISGNTVSYPLQNTVLLLKVAESSFDFDQAKPDGSDIRIYSSSGQLLHHEIEHWGSLNDALQGCIWVRIDSLTAADDFLSISWGNASAVNISSGKMVFDTALGFTGVWHVNQEDPETRNTDVYRDVTFNGNHAEDNIRSLGRDGVVGFGKKFEFDGISKYDYFVTDETRDFDFGSGPFTISTWFKKVQSDESCLLVIRDSSKTTNRGFGLWVDDSDRVVFRKYHDDTTETILTSSAIVMNSWINVVLVRDPTGVVSLYLNGQFEAAGSFAENLTNPLCGKVLIVGTDLNFNATTMAQGGIRPFIGWMDEIRVERSARDENWIKASFSTISGR